MPAKKQNFAATEIKAGLFVLVSVAVLVAFIVVIMKINLAPPEVKRYHTFFNGTLGLNKNAEVRFGGVRVGRVTDIRYAVADDTGRTIMAAKEAEAEERLIRVDFEVLTDVPVNADSEASVQQTTFTAERHLEVSTGTPGAAPLEEDACLTSLNQAYGFIQLPDTASVLSEVEKLLGDLRDLIGVEDANQVPPGDETAPAKEQFQVTRIAATIKNLLEDLDAFLGVDEALQKEEAGEEFIRLTNITATVKGTLEYLQGGLLEEERIAGVLDEAQKLLDQLNGVLAENRGPINTALTDVSQITGDAAKIVDDLTPRLTEIVETLQSLLRNADGLSGNARDFLEDNRPALEDMLADLSETIGYLKTFARTMAEQPQAVIRGKEPEGRKN
ncbi:MAG: MCE family protein [Candidatus Hydrogenedentes bacterium]|nr:MCE family protein [Candidatus Hydrogenedentota bacterium]